MTTRLRPFFKFFGSKWRTAPKYPAPRYDTIVEPFAGSAQYATLYHDRNIVLVEQNARVAALWRWLIGVDPDEIRALPCEQLKPGDDLTTLGLRPEAVDFIARWERTGGAALCTRVSGWHGKPGMWNPSTRESIASQVHAIRHWTIIEGRAQDVSPDVEATWHIDPPYQHVPNVYKVPMPSFQELATWCKSRKGQVIVCEQEGADWLPFEPFADIPTMRRGGKRSREVIWHR